MNQYSVEIEGNDWVLQHNECASIQEVIEYIIEQIRCCDDNSCFLNSEISVYMVGTDQWIAYKENDETLEEFIVELAQESDLLDEVEINSVLEWLMLLEKYIIPSRNIDYIYEEE